MTTKFNLLQTFYTEKLLLKVTGFYPDKDGEQNYFRIFRGIVMGFLAVSTSICAVGIVFTDYDIDELTEMLLITSTHTTFLGKLFNFLIRRRAILQLELMLSTGVFSQFNAEEVSIYQKSIKGVEFVAKSFRFSCILVVLWYALYPLSDDSNKYVLSFPGIFPWNTDKYYYFTISLQVLMIANSAYNNSTLDILSAKLITIGIANFSILKNNLSKINYSQDKQSVKMELVKNLKFYQESLKYVDLLENTFSMGLLLQFLATVCALCFTCFQIMLVKKGTSQFHMLITYLSCMLCQISMYCWYGNEIFAESKELTNACYLTNWYEADVEIKRMLIIFMERAKKPVILTAGKVFTLSLMTLTVLLRSSYSFLAVLRQMYK